MYQPAWGSVQTGRGLSFSGTKTPSGAKLPTQPPDASKISGALLALISSRARVVAGPPWMVMKSKSIPVCSLKIAATFVTSSPPSSVPYIRTLPSFRPASRIACQAGLSLAAAGAAAAAGVGRAGAEVAAGWAAGAAGFDSAGLAGAEVDAGGAV